jgi:hypothetical protein
MLNVTLASQNLEISYFCFLVKYQLPKSIVTTRSKSSWVTTEKVQRESRWKVGSSVITVCANLILLVSQGDVSLSAEDKPPPFAIIRPIPAEATSLLVDHMSSDMDDDDTLEGYGEEEEHHNWLEGHSAIKFLAAGGIAGAGE